MQQPAAVLMAGEGTLQDAEYTSPSGPTAGEADELVEMKAGWPLTGSFSRTWNRGLSVAASSPTRMARVGLVTVM